MRCLVKVLILCFSVAVQACTSSTTTEKVASDTVSSFQSNASEAENARTERLQKLGLQKDTHWRSVTLGDPITAVKANERGTLFEQDATHLGYTVEFPNLESMDVLYRTSQKETVEAIEVDLYLNDALSAAAYEKELSAYFGFRYKPSPGAGGWLGEKGEFITLRNVSKGKDYGLKVKFVQSGPAQ